MNLINLVSLAPPVNLLYMGFYDPILVGLSIAVAVFASYAALLVSQQTSNTTTARARHLWTALGGLCLGIGIWAMHFVGMLAFSLPCTSSYNATGTVLSTIPGILASALAIKIISRRSLSTGRLILGGLLIGVGIGAMHYAGMAAMRLDGLIRYDTRLFLLSILVAIVLATLALWIKFHLQSLPTRWNKWATIASAVMMGLAVSGMHYTAMAAAYFVRDGDATLTPVGIAPAFLAAIVLAATCLIVSVTIIATFIGKLRLLSLGRTYKLISLLLIGWVGIAWLGANYYYDRLGHNLYQQEFLLANQQALQNVSNMNGSIEQLKGVALVVSRDKGTLAALRHFGPNAAPSTRTYEQRKQRWTQDKLLVELNHSAGITAMHLKVDVIWIVNAAGDCIAASNANQAVSFIGANFADRAYFQQVRAGKPGHQYALGRISKIPGLYYGTSVFDKGRFIGAVIVKRDIEKLTSLTNPANTWISDANGVIVQAPEKHLEFKALPEAAISQLSPQQRLLQYGRSTFDALELTPWKPEYYPAATHIGGRADPVVRVSMTLPEDGLTLHSLQSLSQLTRFDTERNWLFLLLAATGSLLIVSASALVLFFRASQRTEADLRVAATAFEAQQGMFITDAASVILRVNRAFIDTTGYTTAEAVGQTPRLLSSGRHDRAFYVTLWDSVQRIGSWHGEIWNRRKNGDIYPQWLSITAVKGRDAEVTHYVGTMDDISQRKTAESEINHLAFYDYLTQLPNRRLLMDRLLQLRLSSARSGRSGALLFIDLDNFKKLNDTLGHDKGDLLLTQVAARLLECVRKADTVARFGGDEFMVMLDGLSNNPAQAASHVKGIGEKILTHLSQPYLLDGHNYHSTSSIGVTLFCGEKESPDDLLKQADLAMYQAKAAGRNGIRFFDLNMQAVVTARSLLEDDLRQSLAKNEFILYYQSQVDSQGGVTGAEALVRWQHPRRGIVPPNDFIPLAEETGLILPLGHWVLETACAQLAAWSKQSPLAHLTLAVNISARQFHQPDFAQQVLAVMERTGVDPKKLKLEITESLLLNDLEDIIAKMTILKTVGVSFSLDDFGTGYSSLAYLKRLPLDQLKIDQSFVRDIFSDPSNDAIARTIVALGNSLGLSVIAEGVETEDQRNGLAQMGCQAYQGYLFGRPLQQVEFDALARQSFSHQTPARANP